MSLTEQKSKDVGEREITQDRILRLGKLWGKRLATGWTAFMGAIILGNLQAVLDGAQELSRNGGDDNVVTHGGAMVILMGTVACMVSVLVLLHVCSSLCSLIGSWANERTNFSVRLLGRYVSMLPIEFIFYLTYQGGILGWETTKEVMLLILLIPVAAEIGQRVRKRWSKRKDNQAIGPDSRHLVR